MVNPHSMLALVAWIQGDLELWLWGNPGPMHWSRPKVALDWFRGIQLPWNQASEAIRLAVQLQSGWLNIKLPTCGHFTEDSRGFQVWPFSVLRGSSQDIYSKFSIKQVNIFLKLCFKICPFHETVLYNIRGFQVGPFSVFIQYINLYVVVKVTVKKYITWDTFVGFLNVINPIFA